MSAEFAGHVTRRSIYLKQDPEESRNKDPMVSGPGYTYTFFISGPNT